MEKARVNICPLTRASRFEHHAFAGRDIPGNDTVNYGDAHVDIRLDPAAAGQHQSATRREDITEGITVKVQHALEIQVAVGTDARFDVNILIQLVVYKRKFGCRLNNGGCDQNKQPDQIPGRIDQ